jgi:hypothetical protein
LTDLANPKDNDSMTHRAIPLVGLLVAAALAARVSASPIDVIARLNPGQSGPVYAWSLLIRVDPGYDVGAIDILTSGFDSFEVNVANPGIGVLDTAYVTDPLGDGRNGLVLNNTVNGVAISSPGEEALLGTFFGPNRTSPPVILWDGEVEYGGTVFDPYLRVLPPDSVSLHAYPRALISLTVVPEPSHLALLALVGLGLLGVRARGVAEPTRAC